MTAILATIWWFAKRCYWFVTDNYKVVLPIIAVLIIGIFLLRACKTEPTIDLDKLNKINSANEKESKQALRDIVEQNQDVIRTVDNRSALNEVNVIEKNREIDAKVKEAAAKVAEAKAQGRDISQEELEALLMGEGINNE